MYLNDDDSCVTPTDKLAQELSKAVDDVLSDALGIRGVWTQSLDSLSRDGILSMMRTEFARIITEKQS